MGHISATVVLGAICLVIWLYLCFLHGRFWRIRVERGSPPALLRRVVAVVPARNEADVVASAIRSLLTQIGVDISVILVDDHSTDSTASIAGQAARDLSAEDRITVISAPPLPEGWTGKLWAVQQGIDLAQQSAPDFILLTDADIEHSPDNVASLVAKAEIGNCDLTSYMVKLACSTAPERLLIPAFVYFFFQLYPPAWIRNPSSPIAGAAGGCMLVRPEALHRSGAMHSLRSEIIDDCALAQRVKKSGGSVWLGPTDSAHSIRPYESFGEIERMIARSAFNQLRHSTALLFFAIIGLLLTYLAPVALLFTSAWPLGLAASALMLITYRPMVRFYRLNPLWALTLPVAASFYLAATVHSAVRYWIGRGGEWKGRAQDQKSTGATHA